MESGRGLHYGRGSLIRVVDELALIGAGGHLVAGVVRGPELGLETLIGGPGRRGVVPRAEIRHGQPGGRHHGPGSAVPLGLHRAQFGDVRELRLYRRQDAGRRVGRVAQQLPRGPRRPVESVRGRHGRGDGYDRVVEVRPHGYHRRRFHVAGLVRAEDLQRIELVVEQDGGRVVSGRRVRPGYGGLRRRVLHRQVYNGARAPAESGSAAPVPGVAGYHVGDAQAQAVREGHLARAAAVAGAGDLGEAALDEAARGGRGDPGDRRSIVHHKMGDGPRVLFVAAVGPQRGGGVEGAHPQRIVLVRNPVGPVERVPPGIGTGHVRPRGVRGDGVGEGGDAVPVVGNVIAEVGQVHLHLAQVVGGVRQHRVRGGTADGVDAGQVGRPVAAAVHGLAQESLRRSYVPDKSERRHVGDEPVLVICGAVHGPGLQDVVPTGLQGRGQSGIGVIPVGGAVNGVEAGTEHREGAGAGVPPFHAGLVVDLQLHLVQVGLQVRRIDAAGVGGGAGNGGQRAQDGVSAGGGDPGTRRGGIVDDRVGRGGQFVVVTVAGLVFGLAVNGVTASVLHGRGHGRGAAPVQGTGSQDIARGHEDIEREAVPVSTGSIILYHDQHAVHAFLVGGGQFQTARVQGGTAEHRHGVDVRFVGREHGPQRGSVVHDNGAVGGRHLRFVGRVEAGGRENISGVVHRKGHAAGDVHGPGAGGGRHVGIGIYGEPGLRGLFPPAHGLFKFFNAHLHAVDGAQVGAVAYDGQQVRGLIIPPLVGGSVDESIRRRRHEAEGQVRGILARIGPHVAGLVYGQRLDIVGMTVGPTDGRGIPGPGTGLAAGVVDRAGGEPDAVVRVGQRGAVLPGVEIVIVAGLGRRDLAQGNLHHHGVAQLAGQGILRGAGDAGNIGLRAGGRGHTRIGVGGVAGEVVGGIDGLDVIDQVARPRHGVVGGAVGYGAARQVIHPGTRGSAGEERQVPGARGAVESGTVPPLIVGEALYGQVHAGIGADAGLVTLRVRPAVDVLHRVVGGAGNGRHGADEAVVGGEGDLGRGRGKVHRERESGEVGAGVVIESVILGVVVNVVLVAVLLGGLVYDLGPVIGAAHAEGVGGGRRGPVVVDKAPVVIHRAGTADAQAHLVDLRRLGAGVERRTGNEPGGDAEGVPVRRGNAGQREQAVVCEIVGGRAVRFQIGVHLRLRRRGLPVAGQVLRACPDGDLVVVDRVQRGQRQPPGAVGVSGGAPVQVLISGVGPVVHRVGVRRILQHGVESAARLDEHLQTGDHAGIGGYAVERKDRVLVSDVGRRGSDRNRRQVVELYDAAHGKRHVGVGGVGTAGAEFAVLGEVIGPRHQQVAAQVRGGAAQAGHDALDIGGHGVLPVHHRLAGAVGGGVDGGLVPHGVGVVEGVGAVPPVAAHQADGHLDGVGAQAGLVGAHAVALVLGGAEDERQGPDVFRHGAGDRGGRDIQVELGGDRGYARIVAGVVGRARFELVTMVTDEGNVPVGISPVGHRALGGQPDALGAAYEGHAVEAGPVHQVADGHGNRAGAAIGRGLVIGGGTGHRGGKEDLGIGGAVERETQRDQRPHYVICDSISGVYAGNVAGVVHRPGHQGIDHVVLKSGRGEGIVPGSRPQFSGVYRGPGSGLPAGAVPITGGAAGTGGDHDLHPVEAGHVRVGVAAETGQAAHGGSGRGGYGDGRRGVVHDDMVDVHTMGLRIFPIAGSGIVGEAGIVHGLDLYLVLAVPGPGYIVEVHPAPVRAHIRN